ncbi:prepilin peptidase [Parvularcula sp. ZS-1/3]|uniref:Prepilin leader peptidase/N-methyltransferase n=1 Tax=Parvularcula mediterranea TaxID=2732508 RepID=A0A7Y3RN19_9PROT|nr:A24 family peptidase [Parvularcula mediterranea]NNU17117.1 prepilin peptidase [Parvularcula mediterranea]
MNIAATLLGACFGALLGSFANVVASRGPRRWGLVAAQGLPDDFLTGRSRCEGCGASIKPLLLVPIVSFFYLGGRAECCGNRIGYRHVLTESLGAAAGAWVAWRYGATPEALFAGVLLFFLLTLAVIDSETGFLPDALTLPLIIIGLGVSALGYGPPLLHAVLGAVIGGGALWLLAFGFRKLRGKEGLGGGDVKLVAAGGAWCGASALPFILLAASLAGLLFVLATRFRNEGSDVMKGELHFGPYLCAATAAVYLIGPPLTLA